MIEHKTVSLADQVFDRLEADILSGKYQRGEILTESRLCSEMGVSRTPIREALRRLGQEHLIEDTAKGSLVTGITDKDIKDIYKIREKIECMAAYDAALNATSEQIRAIHEAVELQEFYNTKHDADHIRYMDSRFHDAIYKASSSSVYFDVLMPLLKKAQKYRKASIESSSRAQQSVDEHKAISKAIENHDADLAYELTIKHVQNAFNHIAENFKGE